MFTQKLKDRWIAEMQAHQDADRLMQGDWLDRHPDEDGLFRGCFFGCAMQTNRKALGKAADAMQLPYELIALAESIFEGLPPEEAMLFPVQLLRAIPVETDLEPVSCAANAAANAAAIVAADAAVAIDAIDADVDAARIALWQKERDNLLTALTDPGEK